MAVAATLPHTWAPGGRDPLFRVVVVQRRVRMTNPQSAGHIDHAALSRRISTRGRKPKSSRSRSRRARSRAAAGQEVLQLEPHGVKRGAGALDPRRAVLTALASSRASTCSSTPAPSLKVGTGPRIPVSSSSRPVKKLTTTSASTPRRPPRAAPARARAGGASARGRRDASVGVEVVVEPRVRCCPRRRLGRLVAGAAARGGAKRGDGAGSVRRGGGGGEAHTRRAA